jgi:YgiT-type zinc finger domain-containing protein
MADKKHRCGGTFQPGDVTVRDERSPFLLTHVVPGFVCNKCGEELIDRDAMAAIQALRTPAISFSARGVSVTSAVDLRLSLATTAYVPA